MNRKTSAFTILLLAISVLTTSTVQATPLAGLTHSISGANYVTGASQNSLEIASIVTLRNYSLSVAVNDETNRIYVGVEGELIVIDGEIDQVVGETQLDYYNFSSVSAIAVNNRTNRIFVGAYSNISVIDGTTNLKVGTLDRCAYQQYELAVNPVTNRVYVTDYAVFQGDYDEVRVYNGETFEFITAVNIPGSNTHLYEERVGVAVNPNTNKVYATWSGEDTLLMIDGNANTITKTVHSSSLSKDEIRVLVNPYTNNVYVGSQSKPYNGQTLEEVPVPATYYGYLRAVDSLNNFLYTTKSSTLCRVNGTTHEVIDSVELPWDVSLDDSFAVNPKTSKIYATDTYSNQLYVINARTPTPSPQSTETPSSPPTASSSPTASPSQVQTSMPQENTVLANADVNRYFIAGAAVAIGVVATALVILLRKRKQKHNISIAPLS